MNSKVFLKKALWFALSATATMLAVKVAGYERGYFAIGGEIFVFPLMYILPDVAKEFANMAKVVLQDEKDI